jgi:hypothetical protein
LGNVVVVDVYGGFLAEVLFEVVYLNHISLVFRFCGRNLRPYTFRFSRTRHAVSLQV